MRLVLSLILAIFWLAGTASAAENIGYVKTVNGGAWLERGGVKTAAKAGDAVQLNDLVRTDSSGSVGITFKDETMISVGPDTEMTIDEYLYQPRESKLGMVTSVSKGTMQFVSGVIAKLAPETVKVNTPTGTLGVRGTRFLVVVKN
jgi:hypothetical protein